VRAIEHLSAAPAIRMTPLADAMRGEIMHDGIDRQARAAALSLITRRWVRRCKG
jgi:hypothetical protein